MTVKSVCTGCSQKATPVALDPTPLILENGKKWRKKCKTTPTTLGGPGEVNYQGLVLGSAVTPKNIARVRNCPDITLLIVLKN